MKLRKRWWVTTMTDKRQGHQPKYASDATNPPNRGSGVMPSNTKRIVTVSYGMPCIICGESIELTPNEVMSLEYGNHIRSKVCDKCRAAVLRIREQMEQKYEI